MPPISSCASVHPDIRAIPASPALRSTIAITMEPAARVLARLPTRSPVVWSVAASSSADADHAGGVIAVGKSVSEEDKRSETAKPHSSFHHSPYSLLLAF